MMAAIGFSFAGLATAASRAAGRPGAFIATLALIVLWAACGPFVGFSDTWQLIANTATTLVTTCLCLLIQHSQDKDTRAIQAKLDELIRIDQRASNELIGLEKRAEG